MNKKYYSDQHIWQDKNDKLEIEQRKDKYEDSASLVFSSFNMKIRKI